GGLEVAADDLADVDHARELAAVAADDEEGGARGTAQAREVTAIGRRTGGRRHPATVQAPAAAHGGEEFLLAARRHALQPDARDGLAPGHALALSHGARHP